MFTIKNAIMEVLSKSKSIDEVLSTLEPEDQTVFLAAFDLMKAKLSGMTELVKTYNNGQWQLNKSNLWQESNNTLNYAEINKPSNQPKPKAKPGPALNYKDMDKPKSSGVKERKEQALSENANWKEKGAYGAGIPKGAEDTKKAEDDIEQIKAKYTGPKPKTDNDKINEIKDKYRKENKEKAESPIKVNTALSKPKL